MSTKLLLASAFLMAAVSAHATVSVTSTAVTYTQSFDGLASAGSGIAWANDSTLNGWSLFAAAPVSTYNTGTGSNGSIAGFFSFGAAGDTDRALGSVVTNNFAGTAGSSYVYTALALTNNTGGALTGFTLRYDGEQYRNNGNTAVQGLVLQYGFGATYAAVGAWTTAGASFNFDSPVVGGSAAIVDGNGAGKVADLGGTVTTSWAADSTLWIRWQDLNNSGNDHLLAIDNVRVTAVPEPSTYALLLAGLGAVGFIARRRRG
ncbi:MAG TPA: PEP-CTERM sorting domain-containing protein [Roseateles sp.]